MDTLPTRTLYYGWDGPLPEKRELRAGPLTLLFEGGDLRYVRLGDHEVLRRVYVSVRDSNWDCDDLAGPPRVEPDPKWDRRDALNVICRLDLGAAHLGPPTKRAVTS